MATARMHHGQTLFAARCLNCSAGLVGEFCHLCGQSAKTARITLPSILREIPNAIWTLNRSLPYTLFGLVRRPGYLVRDYVEGRRTRIYSPIALLFFVSGIVGVLTGWFHLSDAGLEVVGQQSSQQLALGEKIVEYYAWVTMLTVPMQAVGPYLMLRKRLAFTFGEHIMIAILIATGAALVGATALPIEWALRKTHHAKMLGPWVGLIEFAKIGYVAWAYAQLQDDGKNESAFARWSRGVAGYFATMVFWVGAVIALTACAIAAVIGARYYYRF